MSPFFNRTDTTKGPMASSGAWSSKLSFIHFTLGQKIDPVGKEVRNYLPLSF